MFVQCNEHNITKVDEFEMFMRNSVARENRIFVIKSAMN